jgi:hypothetical protein
MTGGRPEAALSVVGGVLPIASTAEGLSNIFPHDRERAAAEGAGIAAPRPMLGTAELLERDMVLRHPPSERRWRIRLNCRFAPYPPSRGSSLPLESGLFRKELSRHSIDGSAHRWSLQLELPACRGRCLTRLINPSEWKWLRIAPCGHEAQSTSRLFALTPLGADA